MVTVNLAQSKPIASWKPTVGDFIVWHGWFTHWFGIVNSINVDGTVTVTKAGLPVLLFTMNDVEVSKNKTNVSIAAMNNSRGGKYAVLQTLPGSTNVWFV